MRLYAFLLVAGAVIHARAASIPVPETEEKLTNIVPDNLDKVPEKTPSEQELDQTNFIKDDDNSLSNKPNDIPVEVIVENVEPALKVDAESEEEINRPAPDLRNPGPPQRQEHETQNPEFYATEQQSILLFKQSVSEAQNVLKQGFQGIADGIQNIIGNNEPIQTLQTSIQSLREGFNNQMNKVNNTIQSYLNSESSNSDKPAVEQTKAGFNQIEKGLFKLRNDFNREVNTLVDGVGVVALLKAESETPSAGSGSISAPASSAPTPIPASFSQYLQNVQTTFNSGLQNLSDRIQNFLGLPSSSTAAPAGVGALSDSQVSSATSAAPPSTNIFQNWQNQWNNFVSPGQAQNQSQPPFLGIQSILPQSGPFNFFNIFTTTQAPQAAQPAQVVPKPEPTEPKPAAQSEPAKPAGEQPGPAASPPAGPIRQILQNNPITKGIAGAVQRLQNINNPEKPRDEVMKESVAKPEEEKADSESKKGGANNPNTGDNNNSSDSGDRVEKTEAVKEEIATVPEVEKIPEVEKVPEVQKVAEDKIKELKTEAVVNKTE